MILRILRKCHFVWNLQSGILLFFSSYLFPFFFFFFFLPFSSLFPPYYYSKARRWIMPLFCTSSLIQRCDDLRLLIGPALEFDFHPKSADPQNKSKLNVFTKRKEKKKKRKMKSLTTLTRMIMMLLLLSARSRTTTAFFPSLRLPSSNQHYRSYVSTCTVSRGSKHNLQA
jgi:hypothetical protein